MNGASPLRERPRPTAADTTPVELDKSGAAIQAMFAGVARRYDLLNHLLSANLDRWWRRRAATALALAPGAAALDLCCGTGEQALALARRGARVAAADFCVPMLALARPKFGSRRGAPAALAADALALPFAPGRFAAATVSFGLRNVADLDAALRQIVTVLQPGGQLVVLECTLPEAALLRRLYLRYFLKLLPWVGARISDAGAAYRYLPNSVLSFPERAAFLDHLAAAGFEELSYLNLTGGTVCLYRGKLPISAHGSAREARLALAEPGNKG